MTPPASALRARAEIGAERPGDDRLAALLDLPGLVRFGWDPDALVLTLDPSHRLVDYAVCRVEGCTNQARRPDGLCRGCGHRRATGSNEELDAFCAQGVAGSRWQGERLCAVCRAPGARRPAAAHGLCLSCNMARRRRHQSVEDFVAGDPRFGPARPRPSLGTCSVATCGRLAARVNGLCGGHDQAWQTAGRPALEQFNRTGGVLRGDGGRRVVLHGLPEGVVSEVLYGIQAALGEGRRLSPVKLRCAVDHLRRLCVATVAAPDTGCPAIARPFLEFLADRVALARSCPEAEFAKDVWDLRLWGERGRLSFIARSDAQSSQGQPAQPITQPWLREAAKHWAAEALVSKRPATVRDVLRAVGLWSEHLARRAGGATQPAALGRSDVEAFLARLAHMQAAGTMSRSRRARVVDALALFLRDCRALGLTRAGAPIAGLAEDVMLRRSDHPSAARRESEDVGRALPPEVMTQLLSAESLAVLEGLSGSTGRAAVELLAGVGRRTGELCSLRLGCLDYDSHAGADGVVRRTPVLIHDMPKVNRIGCRLPIHDREAEIISAQQSRVRAAFPATPADELVLFPRARNNPDGTRPMTTGWLQRAVRRWVGALPRLDGGERDPDGSPRPFPRQSVFPYAFRHSFAQRHADAGTPVDALKELLGHDTVRTTLGYYRVTARRKREAQDLLGPLQLDAAGRLVRPGVAGLPDAEALRDQVGQVAVPFGVCTEPSNVAADGHSCPFRHRCSGCEYFRTDPSYQPELSAYLTQLLADRERLGGALPQLAEWARRDAAPSDEEIEAVRRLVRANDEALTALDDEDRAALEQAIATMRKDRAALGLSFPVELRGLVRQPTPSLFPTIEADTRTGRTGA